MNTAAETNTTAPQCTSCSSTRASSVAKWLGLEGLAMVTQSLMRCVLAVEERCVTLNDYVQIRKSRAQNYKVRARPTVLSRLATALEPVLTLCRGLCPATLQLHHRGSSSHLQRPCSGETCAGGGHAAATTTCEGWRRRRRRRRKLV